MTERFWYQRMNDIKLSVIVPVFNTEEYLAESIGSICNQTYNNLEILIIDDGSNDICKGLCDELSRTDKRIRVVHKENSGQLSARKVGAELATGDYIVSVDSDDWIDDSRFYNVVNYGLVKLPDMVYMRGYYKETNMSSVFIANNFSYTCLKGREIQNEFLAECIGESLFLDRHLTLAHWQSCIKREIYKKNITRIDSRIRRIEDFISIFSCVLDCKHIECIDESGYHYRERDGSINRRKTNWQHNHAEIFYRQMQEILNRHDNDIEPTVKNVATQYCYHNLFLTNYRKLYQYYKDYLFPYSSVMDGSRIVIYGAGNIGVEMINAVDADNRFEVVAWVDREAKKNPRSSHPVETIDVMLTREFDYVVIAILVAERAQRIKRDIVSMGISENKIALMQTVDMSMDKLDAIFDD